MEKKKMSDKCSEYQEMEARRAKIKGEKKGEYENKRVMRDREERKEYREKNEKRKY